MRIPFIKRASVDKFDPAQAAFIKDSQGGSAFIFAGVLFWVMAGLVSVFAPISIAVAFYIFGGFSVPVLGFVIARMQGAELNFKSKYTILVIISDAVTVFGLPLLFLLKQFDPRLVAPALSIINAAHLLIMMWVQLDYTYFLLAMVGLMIGLFFGFSLPEYALVGTGLLYGFVSLFAGFLVQASSHDPLKPYIKQMGDE